MKKIDNVSFERDPKGLVLPTLRNKNVVDNLIKIYGSKSEIPESFQEDVNCFCLYEALWNNNGSTDWYSTPEVATRMHQAKILTVELNKKYSTEI